MSTTLTDRHDDKADRIALAAIHRALRKLRVAAAKANTQGRCDVARETDRVADSLGDIATELRLRIEGGEVF